MNIVRKLIYNTLCRIDIITNRRRPLIVVLCYHNIGSDKWKFTIPRSVFKKQINYLLKGRDPISLSTLKSYINGETEINKPSFVLTFDDGCRGVMNVSEWLKNKSIKPTMFLLSDTKNANRKELNMHLQLLENRDIKNLIKNGWEIGCHSRTHTDFNNLGKKIDDEVSKSKEELEKHLNVDVNYFSFPKGRYNSIILDAVKNANYQLSVTMDDIFIDRSTNVFTIPRIGIDKTHSFNEFIAAISPSNIKFRGIIKKTFLGKHL